jgi:hypothetical protein
MEGILLAGQGSIIIITTIITRLLRILFPNCKLKVVMPILLL